MKTKEKRIRKWILAGLCFALAASVLAACTPSGDPNDPNNRRTLRIGVIYGSKSDESWVRSQYTDMFEYSHPGIDIEIVSAIDYQQQQFESVDENGRYREPDVLEKIKEIMTGNNPVDVMILDITYLGPLVNENMLMQLDPLLKEDKLDTGVYVESVMDAIRSKGNGNLYALAPTFNPSALYYNKKLFRELGVNPPTDNMSWEEVFALARQIARGSGEDAIFGLTFNSWGGAVESYWEIQQFASPLQLKLYDDQAERMTVNTPQWKKLWQTIYDLREAKVIPSQEDMQYFYEPWREGEPYRYNPFSGRPFFQGRVAMTIGDYSMINDLQMLTENAEKIGMEPIEWDVVSTPYHEAVPGVGMNVSINSLFAINAKAQNPEDAWEYVKFVNGEDWAKFKSRSTYEMPTRVAYIKPREGMSYNVEAFIKMQPAPWPGSSLNEQRLLREKPNLYMVNELVSVAYNSVFVQKQRTVDEALAWLEEKGNDLLQRIKANPDGPIEGFWDEIYGGGGGGGGMPIEVRPMLVE